VNVNRLTENKIILITRSTRLEELVARFNTIGQAKFYIEHLGADFSDYEVEHSHYKTALKEAEQQLQLAGRLQVVDRGFLPNFVFGEEDTVVVLGQDGLVANTMKYLNTQPVLGVNPDPERWDGVLLPFHVEDLFTVVLEVFAKRRVIREITMAKATLNNGQTLYGVNDLFIGQKSHVSARYQICIGARQERQSSSGVIVSTGLGSTGWFKSVLAGVRGIGAALGKRLDTDILDDFKWESEYLYYSVREPFPSKASQAGLVFGKVVPDAPLELVSHMPERGVIFSDGMEADFLEFTSGTRAAIAPAEKKGHLVI
jgi:NAD kinase